MAEYGKRPSGTTKGRGFFGELKRPDGSISTELTAGFDFGDGEEDVPLLVPTLTKAQIDHLLSGKKPTEDIYDTAVKFAVGRKRAGMPYYATPEEEGTYKVPKERAKPVSTIGVRG